MNKIEAARILKKIDLLFRKSNNSPLTDEDIEILIDTWAKNFREEQFESVEEALNAHIKKSTYAPTIADLKREISRINNPTPEEAWQIIDRGLGAYGNSLLDYLEGKVLETARRFQVSSLGSMSPSEAKKAFIKAYEEIINT